MRSDTYDIKFKNLRISYMSEINKFKKITHTFLSGKLSATVVIPIQIARKYGLNEPSNVVVEEHPVGILIRKVEV